MSAYYELVALAGFTHARPDYAIDSIEIDGEPVSVEERVRPMDAVLPVASLSESRAARTIPRSCWSRRCRGTSPRSCEARSARCLRDHQVLHHRLDQPAQRQARGRPLLARGLYPAPDRFRPPHRRGLPYRRRLPADGLGACGDRGDGAGAQRAPAGEPDSDGRADRRAHLAEQGQRARQGKADGMVPLQYDRDRSRPSSRDAAGASIPAFSSSAPS